MFDWLVCGCSFGIIGIVAYKGLFAMSQRSSFGGLSDGQAAARVSERFLSGQLQQLNSESLRGPGN